MHGYRLTTFGPHDRHPLLAMRSYYTHGCVGQFNGQGVFLKYAQTASQLFAYHVRVVAHGFYGLTKTLTVMAHGLNGIGAYMRGKAHGFDGKP